MHLPIARGFRGLVVATLLALSVFAAGTVDAAAPANIRLCYLFFGGVDDLGYTFSFNVARLKIHENIEATFPNSTVTSMAAQDVFFMTLEAQRAVLADFVRQGCNIVAANNQYLLHKGNFSEVSALYPNVTFFTIPLVYQHVLHNTLPNFVYMVQVPRQAFYVKGAAAARQASTCVGIIAAFEEPGNPMDSVNGALRGIRDENPTIPIHVVTMNSWYWPDGEADAARLLMRRGCEVIMRYSDPRTVDITVASEAPAAGFFSVGPHSDLQRYVGDSVLVASYVAWDIGLTPLFAQVLRDGRPDYARAPYAFGRGVVMTTELSPRSSQAAREAYERANQRLDANPDVYCGVLRLRNGTVVNSDPSRCLNLTYQTPLFLETSGTTYHGSFRHRSECGAGTFAAYTVAPWIGLTCTPCAAGTFSAVEGAEVCVACPNGTTSEPGSSHCTAIPAAMADEDGVASWLVPVVVVVAVLLLAVGAVALLAMSRGDPLEYAPLGEGGPFCVFFVGLANESALHDAYTDESVAVATNKLADVVRGEAKAGRCYHAQRVNDGTFMLTATTPARALHCASRIAQKVNCDIKWRASLRPRPCPCDSDGSLPSRSRSTPRSPLAPMTSGSPTRAPRAFLASPTNAREAQRPSPGPARRGNDENNTTSSTQRNGATMPLLRVSIGIAVGFGAIDVDPEARTALYRGDVVSAAAAATDSALPGQVVATQSVVDAINEELVEVPGTFIACRDESENFAASMSLQSPMHQQSTSVTPKNASGAAGGPPTLYWYQWDGYGCHAEVAAEVEAQEAARKKRVRGNGHNSGNTNGNGRRGAVDESRRVGGIASALAAATNGIAPRSAAVVMLELPALSDAALAPTEATALVVAVADAAARHRGHLHDVLGTRVIVTVNAIGPSVSAPVLRAAQIAREVCTMHPTSQAGNASHHHSISAGVACGTLVAGAARRQAVAAGNLIALAELALGAAKHHGVPALLLGDAGVNDVSSRFECVTLDVVLMPDGLDGAAPTRHRSNSGVTRLSHIGALLEAGADGEWLYAFGGDGPQASREAQWDRLVLEGRHSDLVSDDAKSPTLPLPPVPPAARASPEDAADAPDADRAHSSGRWPQPTDAAPSTPTSGSSNEPYHQRLSAANLSAAMGESRGVRYYAGRRTREAVLDGLWGLDNEV